MIMKYIKFIIQVLSLLIFIICAVYLFKYFYGNYTAQKDIAELQNIASEDKDRDGEEESYAENGMLSEYYELYQRNNDLVGWIRIANTVIDYPVMYRNSDNEYYLHRNFDREYQYSGLPFMDKDCDLAKPGDNLIIYSHNMKNGTMFAPILKYADKDYLSEHREIEFDTMYKREKYIIISVFRTQVGSQHEFKYYNFTDSHSEEDFENFVDAVKKLSLYNIDESAVYGDKLLTLSTCSYNRKNERFVVVAKKIAE